MASRASRRRADNNEEAPPPLKRGRKAVTVSDKKAPTAETHGKQATQSTGRGKSAVSQNTSETKTKETRKATLGVRRVAGKNTPTMRPVPDTDGDDVGEGTAETESQVQVKTVKRKIKAILELSKKQEQAIIDDVINDSDDDYSEGGRDTSQATMAGNQDYTEHPHAAEIDDEEDNAADDDILDLSTATTKMRMVEQDTSIYDDPRKSHDDWWSEDPTREATLCELWHEERSLYDFTSKGYIKSEDRPTIMKRFSTILQVPPHIIETRMASIRNHYQRMHRQAKSGSEPEGRTDRQREILRLLWFLRQHIKTSDSLTTYKTKSPVVKPAVKNPANLKSTPKAHIKTGVATKSHAKDLSSIQDLSGILNHALTPIKPHSLTPSEDRSGSEEEFVINNKHFHRNDRLHDNAAVNISARRSLRLTPSPKVKKTSNAEDIKKSKSAKASSYNVVASTSSCRDTAPLATKKPKSTPVAKNNDNNVLPKKMTAADRKLAMTKKTGGTVSPSNTTTTKSAHVLPKKTVTTTSAAERKLAMASTSSKEARNYDVTLDTAWHDKQGPAFRRAQELAKKKKEKEKDNPMIALMQEKAEHMRKLTAGIDQMAARSTVTGVAGSNAVCPEQLWADSLVPHLQRMDQERKDAYMYHVLGLAFKAIKGTWPDEEI